MELKQIKELMTAMERLGLTKLVMKNGEFELELAREGTTPPAHHALDEQTLANLHLDKASLALLRGATAGSLAAAEKVPGSPAKAAAEVVEDTSSLFVKAPLVGTLYLSPSPEAEPFVRVGDRIQENTVVCIVEAMKVMNEVKAGVAGTVKEILVDNSHPVEYGTKLFRVAP